MFSIFLKNEISQKHLYTLMRKYLRTTEKDHCRTKDGLSWEFTSCRLTVRLRQCDWLQFFRVVRKFSLSGILTPTVLRHWVTDLYVSPPSVRWGTQRGVASYPTGNWVSTPNNTPKCHLQLAGQKQWASLMLAFTKNTHCIHEWNAPWGTHIWCGPT